MITQKSYTFDAMCFCGYLHISIYLSLCYFSEQTDGYVSEFGFGFVFAYMRITALQWIINCRSYPQLRATFEEYQKLSGKDIAESISSEMSGDLKKGMLTVGKQKDYISSISLF